MRASGITATARCTTCERLCAVEDFDVEQRNDDGDLFIALELKGGIAEHLVGQL